MAIIATLALFIVVGLVLRNYVFVIRQVALEGNFSAHAEDVIRAADIDFGSFIRNADQQRIQANLESTGLYALEDMRIQYPNTLVLTVRERTRDGLILSGGKIVVVDSDGYAMEVHPNMPEVAAPLVTGLEMKSYRIGDRINADTNRLSAMKSVLDALRQQKAMGLISELNVENVMDLWMFSRTGIRIELGDEENMNAKILWMRSTVIDLENRGQTVGTLDVSSGARADYRAN